MSKRQLFSLFLGSLVLYVIGNGLLPLLPIYAERFVEGTVGIGYYLAFAYLALALGSILAGWLSDQLQIRKLLYGIAGLMAIPGVWLMGQVTSIWQLAVLTATVWFLIGVGLALMSILTGLFADRSVRGKTFGLLALPIGLGSLIGGATIGPITQRWGYSTMFAALALFLLLWPINSLLLEDKVVARKQRGSGAQGRAALGRPLFFLLLANLLALSANFVANLGRSLAMKDLGFEAGAISSTAAVSGLITLPLPPLIGWLSDHMGRKGLLMLCYMAGSMGLAVLVVASALWHFWIAFCLLAILVVSISVGAALVTDLAPPESLGVAMSLFSASSFGGGVIGFAGTGHAIELLGMTRTLVLGAALPLLGILLLFFVGRRSKQDSGVS